MSWNKVNLRAKEKNLPPSGKRVLWATNEKAPSKTTFFKFIGTLTKDEKNVDTGLEWYKLTSNFWWMEIEDPEI
jgi:hypothetical protein